MATKNDVTGDLIQTRTITQTYRDNYDLIFGKKDKNAEKKDADNANDPVEKESGQE